MKLNYLIILTISGLIAACGSHTSEMPASPPTREIVPPTESPATPRPATDTKAAPTGTTPPTDAPTTAPVAGTNGVSFQNDILPIFESRCLNCHGGQRTEEGLNMRIYASLMAGSDNGLVIFPGNADTSLLVELVVSKDMPKRGPKLTPPQIQLIIDWINQGALNN